MTQTTKKMHTAMRETNTLHPIQTTSIVQNMGSFLVCVCVSPRVCTLFVFSVLPLSPYGERFSYWSHFFSRSISLFNNNSNNNKKKLRTQRKCAIGTFHRHVSQDNPHNIHWWVGTVVITNQNPLFRVHCIELGRERERERERERKAWRESSCRRRLFGIDIIWTALVLCAVLVDVLIVVVVAGR